MKSISYLCALLLVAALLLSACGSSSEEEKTALHRAPNGDLQETTASLEQMPQFLQSVSKPVETAYKAAAAMNDVLQYMPCYCGCAESAGHQSNLNCFIKEVKSDGTAVWDDHGTRCNVCVEIALNTADQLSKGKSPQEIRKWVDQQYQRGYAEPTPTPMPS